MKEKLCGSQGLVIPHPFCPQQNTQPDLPCHLLLLGNLLQEEMRQGSCQRAGASGDKDAKINPPRSPQGVQKGKGSLQELGSTACVEQAVPAVGLAGAGGLC